MVLFLEYPKCSTCIKAKKWLDEHGVQYEDRHIKENRPNEEELKAWIEKSSLLIKRFFNTSGMVYKSLELKERLPEMTDEEKIKILATDGMLVKRPLIIGDGGVLVGFKPAEWEACPWL